MLHLLKIKGVCIDAPNRISNGAYFWTDFYIKYYPPHFCRPRRKKQSGKPSIIQRVALGIQVALTFLMVLMALLGVIMRDTEMTIVSAIIGLGIFTPIVYFTRRKFKKYYEENEDYFYLHEQYLVNRVYYENITDWVPLKKQRGVLDSTQELDVYVVVNFAFHNPEILLTKLAEMIFSGELKPNKEKEFAAHLEKNGYGYIVEPYLKDFSPSEN